MTDAQFDVLCRSLLNDKGANFWDSDEYTALKSAVLTAVTAKWWNLLAEIKEDWQDVDIPASNRIIDLPATCQKILRIEQAETGDKIGYAWRNEIFYWTKAGPGDPIRWCFKAGKIYIFPTSGAALTAWLRIRFMPRAQTMADLPECLHPVLALELVIMARLKDEKVDQGLVLELRRFEDAAMKELVQAQSQEPYIEKAFNDDEAVDED